MKKILLCFFIFFNSSIFGADDINVFISKANITIKKINIVEKKIVRVNKNYESILKKIEKIKEQISKSAGLIKNLKNVALNYYLFRGNRTAYNMSILKNELKELKDDYFTYVVLIIDEYNKKINNCINEKCPFEKFTKIYFERKRWVELIKDYEELLSIEELIPVFYISFKKDEKNDIKNYFEKKLIQINQVIIILNEEKGIIKKAIEYGIKTEQERIFELENKIKLLINKKKEVEKRLYN